MKSARGFTLLEVMITLAILAGALTLVARSQQASMKSVAHGRQMTIAVMLAKDMMVDIEDELIKNGYPELNDEKTGDFDDQGFSNYRYRLNIEKIELPSSANAEALKDTIETQAGDESKVAGAMGAGADLISQQFEIFRTIFEASIRRVSLEVSWNEGAIPKSISVMTYFTDPRRVDAAIGGGLSDLLTQQNQDNANDNGSDDTNSSGDQ